MRSKQTLYSHSRRVVSSFYFIQGLIFASWASRIPDIKELLSLSEAALGGVLFGIPVGQMCAMALSAWAVGRFSSRRTLMLASLLCPLSMIPIGFVNTPLQLTVALFFFGASTNLFNISVNTQGVDVERIFNKNIMASFHGLWSLGGFTGAVLSMVLVGFDLAVREHFIIIALFSVITAMLLSGGLMNRDVKPESKGDSSSGKALSKIDGYILTLGIMAFCAMVTEGAMYDWSGVYFNEVVAAPDNLVRLGYIVCMSTMTLGRFIAGGFINRFGNSAVVRGSGLLIALGLMISVLMPDIVTASIGFFIVGFGISSTVPICYSMAGRSRSLSPGAALAAVSTIGYLGFLLGPPVIGFVAHAITLRWTFAVIAAVGLVIALLSGRLKRCEVVDEK